MAQTIAGRGEDLMWKKICTECKREFQTDISTKKRCSFECRNVKQRNNARGKAFRLKELEDENRKLRKQLQEKEHD